MISGELEMSWGAEQDLVGVAVIVLVEATEALGREPDRGGCGEVDVAAVEEVEEGVLQNLGPHGEVLEVGAALGETADDGVGNVSNAGLQRVQVLGHPTHLDLMLQELDQVRRNRLRGFILRRVHRRLVRVVSLHDGHDLLGVDGDLGGTDAVLGTHDHHGLGERGLLGHIDVMQTLERGARGVNLDDDLVGHLDQFGRSTHRSTGDDTAVLGDGGSLDDGNIDLVLRLVQSVPALVSLAPRHPSINNFSTIKICYVRAANPEETCSDAYQKS